MEEINTDKKDNKKEEELQKIIYQAKVLEEHASALNTQIAQLKGMVQEITRTIETLDGLNEINKSNSYDKEILLPIGKNVFVSATLKSRNVLFGITDNVFIEKAPGDAKNSLLEDIKKINNVIENLNKQHSEIINKISALDEYSEQLARGE